MSDQQNPFEALDLNPRHDVRALTAELQERARRASPQEKAKLQESWRALTQRHADRVRWALLTHPRDDESAQSIDALRHQVPRSRQELELPELVPTIEDALLLPRTLPAGDEGPEPTFFDLSTKPDHTRGQS